MYIRNLFFCFFFPEKIGLVVQWEAKHFMGMSLKRHFNFGELHECRTNQKVHVERKNKCRTNQKVHVVKLPL